MPSMAAVSTPGDKMSTGTAESVQIQEKYQLLEWTDTVEIKAPNLFIPQNVASFVAQLPYYKLAVSPHLDKVVTMSNGGELNIYTLSKEVIELVASVRVLEDDFAEFCTLEFTASGQLILATRSTPRIDVFDSMGGYFYEIHVGNTESFDCSEAISCIRTVPCQKQSDKYHDTLYVLQYNGQLSVYQIGRLSRYQTLWSIQLPLTMTSTFEFHGADFLIVASEYATSQQSGGLSTFRFVEGAPHLVPIKVHACEERLGWSSLGFIQSSSAYSFIGSLSCRKAYGIGVATSGDVFLFDLPSTDVAVCIPYKGGPRPVQATFVDELEVVVLFTNGSVVRSSVQELEDNVCQFVVADEYLPRARLCCPINKELFVISSEEGSPALREAVTRRRTLACRLWIYTIWMSFKKLVGMAVGEAATPLQMATYAESLNFSLCHSPTRTLKQLLERALAENDYDKAKQLAVDYPSIDSDVIFKHEWKYRCSKGEANISDAKHILMKIRDEDFVAQACLSCPLKSIPLQRVLNSTGLSLKSIPTELKLRLLHQARLLSAISDSQSDLFLDRRSLSCLQVAKQLAEDSDFVTLNKLMKRNPFLMEYNMYLMSYIPPAVSPHRYEQLIPLKNQKENTMSEDMCEYNAALNSEAKSNPLFAKLVDTLNVGENHVEKSQDMNAEDFARKKATEIDEESGLISHSILLLQLFIQNGFENLNQDLDKWKYYNFFVNLCSDIHISYTQFCNFTAEDVVISLANVRIAEGDLVSQCREVISLLEFIVEADQTALAIAINQLVRTSMRSSLNILLAFRERLPKLIDHDTVLHCLCELETTGEALLRDLRRVDVFPEMASAIRSLMDRGNRPVFRRLWQSTKEKGLAQGFLRQMISASEIATLLEWETLRDDVISLSQSLYSHVLSRSDVLELLASHLLLDVDCVQNIQLLETILTLDPKGPKDDTENRLGSVHSARIVLELCSEAIQSTAGDDKNLVQARILASLAKKISPKEASERIKLLDIIDLVRELGCPLLPVAIQFAEPSQLLSDVVSFGNNYKHGKKCAKLAVLLGIKTPVATGLSQCALKALEHGDHSCVNKYLHEIYKARDIPVVQQLCMKLLKANLAPDVSAVGACALLNCSDEELEETLSSIKIQPDVIHVDKQLDKISKDIALDEMYTRASQWSSKLSEKDRRKLWADCRDLASLNVNQNILMDLAKLISHSSSTCAVPLSLAGNGRWTQNDILYQYSVALNHFRSTLTLELAEKVPPLLLIDLLNSNNDDNSSTLNRLASYGADRERFTVDAEYRKETVIGLAMTDDDDTFSYALRLAENYGIESFDVHFASLKDAFSSYDINTVKLISKRRNHLRTLRMKANEFHRLLRKSIYPIVRSNDQVVAYMALFDNSQKERLALPAITEIIRKHKDIEVKKLISESTYLAEVLCSFPNSDLLAVANPLRHLEIGPDACDAAVRKLLNERGADSILVLDALLGNDHAYLLELISNKPVAEEIGFLENAIQNLDSSESLTLYEDVMNRLNLLKVSLRSCSPSDESSSSSTAVLSRRRR